MPAESTGAGNIGSRRKKGGRIEGCRNTAWQTFVACAVLAITVPGILTGQGLTRAGLGRFVIAVDNVGPDVAFPVPNTPSNGGMYLPWVTGGQSHSDSISFGQIPLTRWEQLRDLGIDMGHMYLSDVCMHNGGIARLREAAARYGIMLGLSDIGISDGITNYSGMERIAIHPESDRMVDTVDAFYPEPVEDSAFVDEHMDFSHFVQTPALNAVRFARDSAGNDRYIRGWLLRRMLYPGDNMPMYQGKLRKDGIYYLSLRVRYDGSSTPAADTVPDDTTTVLLLQLEDERSGTAHRFTLRGQDFYTAGSLRHGAFESLLDIIRVTYDEESGLTGIVTGLAGDPDTNVPWPGMNEGPAITPAEYTERMGFNIQYMPFSPHRPVILLDAMLLSCGKAFALFNQDSPFIPATWRPRPIEFLDSSITQMCRPGTTPPVALVMLDESDVSSGNIDAARFVSHRVRTMSNGATLPLVYGPAGMGLGNYRLYTWGFSTAIEGLYSYGVSLLDDAGSRLPLPGEAGYYQAQFSRDGMYGRMRSVTDHYRHFAQVHRATEELCDWIPAVQNYAYGLMAGDPRGNPASDTYWLREPTIAELRCSVHLALAYGAKGIMYYVFSSTPGQDTTSAGNIGMQGFLTFDHCMRSHNVYGEDLWDTVRTFNHGPLRTLGDSLYPLRYWRGFSIEQHPQGLIDGMYTLKVTSEQQGYPDASGETYVEVTEFNDPDPSLRNTRGYIFLVNKRTDSHGARTVRISARRCFEGGLHWRVTDILNGRVYDTQGYREEDAVAASGISVELPPGGATLLRFEAVEDIAGHPPVTLQLGQNYPNPASEVTRVPFTLARQSAVSFSMYDALGRCVYESHVEYGAGSYDIPVQVRGLAAGVYTYRITTPDGARDRRMIVF